MDRSIASSLIQDSQDKIILLSGPRQCGKTTLSRMICKNAVYLNFDSSEDRLMLMQKSWDRSSEMVVFDELHKMKNWKSWLKGIYDTEGLEPRLIVTGSAKLDAYRKVGDSLAGRYFQYRLHPFDLKEICEMSDESSEDDVLDTLLKVGGFPEPYLKGNINYYNKWKKTHLDIILRQDLIDLESVTQIQQVETLIELLKSRVGSPVSYSSLAEDLQVSDKTVKRWLTILENMYILFRVTPYHKNVARAMLKMPKYYFYDTGQVAGDSGIRLENLVACALLKEIHFQQDVNGKTYNLHYLQNKQHKEVDFLITHEGKPCQLIEVKWGDDVLSKGFYSFGDTFAKLPKTQIVKNLKRNKSFQDGARIVRASTWLKTCELG